MHPSKSLPGGNLALKNFTVNGHSCSVYTSSVYTSKSDEKLAQDLFAWPEIIADLLTGIGLDNDAAQAGRGGIFFFSGSRVAAPVVVRQYRHGGFWRFLSGARFFSQKRFLTEFAIHQRAAAIGVPVPEAVALIVIKKERQPVFVNGYFVTFKLPDCQTLPEFLHSAINRTRLTIFFKLGSYLEKLHTDGIFYTDMHVKNILVNSAGEPYLIDFDKSRKFSGPLSKRLRRVNLQRFLRSLEKFSSRGGRLTDSERAAFLIAYAPDSRRYAELYRQLQRGRFLRRLFYRLGWWLNRS